MTSDIFAYFPIEIGVEQEFSIYQFLRAFPIDLIPMIEKPIKLVKIKRAMYKVFQMPMGTSIKRLEEFCYKNSRHYGKKMFHSSFIDDEQYLKVGISIYNGKHRSFVTTGFADRNCLILFPKNGSRSDMSRYPSFLPLNIILPTDPALVENKLVEKSMEIKGDPTPDKDFRAKILTKLVYASFIYHSPQIWKSSAIPENYLAPYLKSVHRGNMIAVTTKMSESDIQRFERLRIEVVLGKIRAPVMQCITYTGEKVHEPLSSDTFMVDAKTEKLDQESFRKKYVALTPDALKVFFKFLRDAIVDEGNIKEFFSMVMPLIYTDKLKVSVENDPKQLIKIEYQPN